MARTVLLLLAICIISLVKAQDVVEFGECKIHAIGSSTVSGTIQFTRTEGETDVDVSVNLAGLPNITSVGIHVHWWGDVSDTDAGLATGGHFVGAGSSTHACPPADRHEGDMGNWDIEEDGTIVQTKTLNLLTLTGVNSIIGRAVIVHAQADDCTTQPTGAAGARLGQCVIGIGNMATGGFTGTNAAGVSGLDAQMAVCDLTVSSPEADSPAGRFYFTPAAAGGVTITGSVTGITGEHGLHIHSFGDLSAADFTSAGTHWNPTNASHGLPGVNANRHAGDLGNVQTYSNNVAYYQLTSTLITSVDAILGRALVLHNSFDHGAGEGCDQAGTSGTRLLACVIGTVNATALSVPEPPVNIDTTFVTVQCTSAAGYLSVASALVIALALALMA